MTPLIPKLYPLHFVLFKTTELCLRVLQLVRTFHYYRKCNKMSQDEQARSLMGEWSNFADGGEKI